MEPHKLVDDTFLADYYQEPPRGLQQEVYRMISAHDDPIVKVARPRPVRRAAYGLLAACLLLAVGLGASLSARAGVTGWMRTVAGIGFHENPDPDPYPIDPELSATAPAPEQVFVKDLPALLPFAFRIPQAPDRYFQSSMAMVIRPHPKWADGGWTVVMRWEFDANDQALISRKQRVRMTVRNGASQMGLDVAPEMTEEVMVGGQPTALTRGIWLDSGGGMRWQTEEGGNEHLTLTWRDGDLLYQLESDERGFLPRLIEMAETIR